jgi:hypothetical protein
MSIESSLTKINKERTFGVIIDFFFLGKHKWLKSWERITGKGAWGL